MFNNDFVLICELHWVPPKRKGTDKAIEEKIYRRLAKFPKDYSAAFTCVVENYSPECIDGFHIAKIRIPFALPEQLKKLISDSDVLLFDGLKVDAICRNIRILE